MRRVTIMEEKRITCLKCGSEHTEAEWLKVTNEKNGINITKLTIDDFITCPTCNEDNHIEDIILNSEER